MCYIMQFVNRVPVALSNTTKLFFLPMEQGFPHKLPVLENVIVQPHVRRVACDDVTMSRALLLYKIAFILLGSDRKQ